MSKLKFHNKIATILRSGNVVSVDEIKMCFDNDEHAQSLLYRLSTYIYDIRKYENGIIKVFKNGRIVTGYQLINAAEFNDEGRYVGKQLPAESQDERYVEDDEDVVERIADSVETINEEMAA
jgi:hypothetical protein